jgi:hypothetical protein
MCLRYHQVEQGRKPSRSPPSPEETEGRVTRWPLSVGQAQQPFVEERAHDCFCSLLIGKIGEGRQHHGLECQNGLIGRPASHLGKAPVTPYVHELEVDYLGQIMQEKRPISHDPLIQPRAEERIRWPSC